MGALFWEKLIMYHESAINRKLCIAPMMEYTDRHGRFFLRKISHQAHLYSEMITAKAVVYGSRESLLGFDVLEQPVALQLGGSNFDELSRAAAFGESIGYREINFNVGCPSNRVQTGRFGACLMAEPCLVAQCVKAMAQAVSIPITVKCRLGITGHEGFPNLAKFIELVSDSGTKTFALHARIAVLDGLTPKENREIPPLDYGSVYRIKELFPDLEIILNGGVKTIDEIEYHLRYVDGVMVGRAAFQDPYMLAQVDSRIFCDEHDIASRHEIVRDMLPYMEHALSNGVRLNSIARHMLGLFYAQPGGRRWRRYLSENMSKPQAGIKVIESALALVPE